MAGELNALISDKPNPITPNQPSAGADLKVDGRGALNNLIPDSFHEKESNTEHKLDMSKYTPYIEDVYSDQDINEQRAQKQSSAAKIGSGVVNAVSQTGIDIIKDAAYLLDMRNVFDFHKQAENGFNNFVSDAMTKTEEDLKLPIYRTKESQGFSPWSSGWWGDNLPSILSTVSMAIPAEGAVMGLSKLGKLMGGTKLLEGIETATGLTGIGDKLEGLTGAVLSRHMESLMEGGQTYQDTYAAAMQKEGMTEAKAKQIAGEAAANNYKYNWANLVTDIPQYMLLHKTFSKSLEDMKFSKAEVARTIFSESAEEGYQFITNEEAKRNALIKAGVQDDDKSTLEDRLGKYAQDGEFWTSVFLGGLGGGLFSAGGSLTNQRKMDKQKETFDALSALHAAVVKGDPSDFNRQSDKVFTNTLMDHISEDHTNDLKEALKATIGAVESKEDRLDTQKSIQERNQVIDFANDLKTTLSSDNTKIPELKAVQLESAIQFKLGTKRMQEIDRQLGKLSLEDNVGLNMDLPLHQFKMAKLEMEATKGIPSLQSRYEELNKQVDKGYDAFIKEGVYKSKKAIDEAISSPNDPELTRLSQNKAIERNALTNLKNTLYKLSTPEGVKELTSTVEAIKEIKQKQAEEQTNKEAKIQADKNAAEKIKQNKVAVTEELVAKDKASKQEDINKNLTKWQDILDSESATPSERKEAISQIDSLHQAATMVENTTPIEDTTVADESHFDLNTLITQSNTTSPELPDIDSPTVISKIASNEDVSTDTTKAITKSPSGMKVREYNKSTVVNFAYLSFEYETLDNEVRNKSYLQTIYDENGLPLVSDSDARLSSSKVKAGDKLEIRIDKNYKDYTELSKSPDTTPIGIYLVGEDKPIAYVHTPSWIEQNTAEDYKDGVLMDTKIIREAAFKGTHTIVITDKSIGQLNRIENQGAKNKSGYVNSVSAAFGTQDSKVPNKFGDATIVVAKSEDIAITGPHTTSDNDIVNKLYPGVIYAEIPTAVPNKYFGAFLKVAKLDSLGQTDIIIRAIQSHFEKEGTILNGNNLDTVKGLTDFINQLTFVGKNDKRTAKTFDINLTDTTLFFNIGATTDVGFDLSLSAGKALTKLDDVSDQLKATIGSKYFNVDRNKLQSKDKYTLYKLEGNKIIEDKVYDNYSAFLAERVLTSNLQPQILNSGERTFFHQSVIAYSLENTQEVLKATESDLDKVSSNPEIKETKKSEPHKETKLYDDADNTGFDDISTSGEHLSPNFNRTDLKYYRAQDLTLEQQNDVTNSVVALLLKEIESGSNPSLAFHNVLKKFKGAYNKNVSEGKVDRADIIKLVVDNWSPNDNFTGFTALAELKLAQLSTRIDGEIVQTEEGTLEKTNFEASTFETNPKDTASGRLKAFLSFVPKADKKTIIGTDAYYDFNDLYNEIMTYLSDTEFDDMLSELQDLATVKPQYQTVIGRLLLQDKALQNEFFSNFKKRYSEQVQVGFELASNGSSAYIRSSNRSSLSSTIMANWEENLKASSILEQVHEGENIGATKIDVDKATLIHNEFKAITDSKLITDKELTRLSDILAKVGITMSVDALKDIQKKTFIVKEIGGQTVRNPNREFAYKDIQSFLKNKIDYIFKALTSAKEDSLFEDNNPFVNEQDSLRILANAQKKYEVQLQSASYRDALGNTIFAYNNPTYYTNQLLTLKGENNEDYITRLQATAFAGTSDYLKQLKDKNSELYRVFNIARFDATRKSRSNEPAQEFNEMSKKLRELTKLWLYQNQGSTTAQFTMLTYSDKGITNIVSAPKIDTSNWSNTESPAFTMLRNLAVGELTRIKQTQLQLAHLPKEEHIDKYHTDAKGGVISFLFPTLNNSALFEESKRSLKQEYIDGPFLETYLTEGVIMPEVKLIIDSVIKAEVDSWISSKIDTLTTEGIKAEMLDKSYLYGKKNGLAAKVSDKSKILETAITDYVINYAINTGNMIQIMHGDIALAGKKGSHTEGYIKKSYIEYFKRMAKDIAPGIEAKAINPISKIIYANDVKIKTEASKMFDKKLEATDAQALITTKFYITKMFERGALPEAIYKSISTKIDTNPNDYDSHFTETEKAVFFQPRKPVYVKGNIENGINSISYLKMMDYPPLPSMTKGTNMDTIRRSMEHHKVDMVIFNSGAKLGSKNPVTFYDNESGKFTFDSNTLGDHIVDLDSSGFRIQQDNPLKDEDRIIEATQQKKLLFVDIPSTMKFGDKSRGDLKVEYDQKHIDLVNLKFNKLLDRFDAKIDERGNYSIADMTKFQQFIKDTAIEKGWNPNELAMLELTEDKSTFKVPLIYANSTEKIESLLASLLTNNITRVKLPGKAYIQASSVGYEPVNKNVIADSALKYMQEDETGMYSEVAIAWSLKDADNNPLPYEEYVNEDGSPKETISKDLLYLIGMRIPFQGHNSSLRLKVVKFLSPQLGDLMLVPSEITMQMGSDFDVDKVPTYSYNFSKTEGGKLVKYNEKDAVKKLENEIIDINHTVMSHPEVNKLIRQPLDSEGLKDAAFEVEKILNTDKQVTSILNDVVSDKALADNRSGKLLTALTSLSATNHALSQEAGLHIVPNSKGDVTIAFKDDDGKIYTDKDKGNSIKEHRYGEHPKEGAWRLDKVLGFTGENISTVIKGIQSAAVDNAKEQLLGMTNLNSDTYSTAALIVRAGFDESFLVPFLKQEAILELVNRSEKFNDPTEESTSRAKLDDIKIKLLKEYETKAEENIAKIEGLTRSEMKTALKESTELGKSKAYYKLQAQVLYNFLQYEKVAKEIGSLQAALSPESSGVGKSLTEVLYNQERIERAQTSFKFLGNTPNFFNGTAIGNTLDKAIFEGNALYKNLYPYAESAYNSFYKDIQNEVGEDIVITLELKDELNRELRSAIYSKFYTTPHEERERLLLDKFAIDNRTNTKVFAQKSLAQRIFEYNGDNRFLRKLKTELTTKSGEASYILYFSSAAEEQGESLENSIAWQEALSSPLQSEKEIAEDLIKYAYLTGGAQSQSGFVKYVPTDYIQDKLKADSLVNFYQESTFDNVFKQYFQHRPWRAKKLASDMKEVILKSSDLENGKLKKDITPSSFSVDADSLNAASLLVTVNRDGRNKTTLPQFLSAKLGRKWALYQDFGLDSTGAVEYRQIGTLGGFNFKEYDINAVNPESIQTTNNVKTDNSPTMGADLHGTTPDTISTPKVTPIVQAIRDNNLSEVMDHIVATDNEYSALAKYLNDYIGGIHISEDNTDPSKKGSQVASTISINTSILDEKGIHETVLHELIHALTANKLAVDRSTLSQSEREAVESLDRLVKVAKSKLGSKSDKYAYATGSVEEFISYALTDKEFQKDLNSIIFTGKQTILDRIFELISKLLGITVTPGSILGEAVNNVLSILDKDTQSEAVRLSPNFSIDKLRSIAQRYVMNASGFLSKQIQLPNLIKELSNAGLGDIKVKEKSTKDGYYFSRNGRMVNPFSINFSPLFIKQTETTGDLGLDKILNRWRNQERILRSQQTKSPAQWAEKEREIEEVTKKIDELLDKKELGTVLERAKIQLKQVDNLLSKADQTAETLSKALNYISGWEDLNSVFNFAVGSNEAKTIGDIIITASNLRNKWSDAGKNYLVEMAKAEGLKYTKKEMFEGNFDTSLATSLWFDSSVSEVPLEVLMDRVYKKTIFNANAEIAEKHKEIDEKFKPIKKKIDSLIQTREDGTLTGNLVSSYKQEYYDKIKELRDITKSDGRRWGDYWKWVKENSYILSTSDALAGKDDHFTAEELKKAKELLDQYEKDFEAFKTEEAERLSYSDQYINKDVDDNVNLDYQRNLADNIAAWEKEHSPYKREQFEREVNEKTRKASDLKGMKGYKYMLYPKPIERWEDPKYKVVSGDADLRAFYDYFKDTIEEYLEHLPNVNDVQSNTIPELRKTLTEKYITDGLAGALKGIGDKLVSSVTTDNLSEKEYGVTDEETGLPVRILRAGMLANKLSPTEKSYNLERVLKEFVSIGASIKFKSQSEAQLQLGEKMLFEITENLKGPNGPKLDWQNKTISLTNGMNNTRNRVAYMMNTFYGMRKDMEGVGKKPIESGPLKGKTVVASKAVDTVIGYTVAKGLALNPFSAATNVIFASISNRMEAAGSRHFTDNELNKAEAISFGAIFNHKDNRKKISLLMERLQILGDTNQANYGDKSAMDWTFFMQHYGEYAAQSAGMVANLMHRGLWDQIKVNGNELEFPKDTDVFKVSMEIRQLHKYLHGNYQLDSPTMIKKQAWGRMLMVFRNWIPYSLKNRFGAEFKDEALGTVQKGRYLSFGTLGLKSIPTLFKLSLLGRLTGAKVEEVSEVDLSNMKQNLREMSYMATFYLVTMMLKAMAGGLDDDDDEILNYTLNTAMRTEADLAFFVSPKAIKQITKDPIPPLKTVGDFLEMISASGDFIIGNDAIKSGRNKGRSKLFRATGKAFPITNQILTTESAMEQVFTGGGN